MSPKSNPKAVQTFRNRLTRWFARAGRDLPWRRTRDPYAILVSEFMLQQTQVSRVLAYYPRFLGRYPSIGHLARARPAQVREAWDGLGYYRRAANLHRLARTVVSEHRGQVPRSEADLRSLPGVGHYTAGAVACFAFEQPAATLDTNVARVLTRAFHGRGRAPKSGKTTRALTALALHLQPRAGKSAWTFNQSLMELGALVCTARNPDCERCPVQRNCRWKAGKRESMNSSAL